MNFENLKYKIKNADIVTFDIFDTLITRQVLHPIDVFSLVNILMHQRMNLDFDFCKARVEAENILLQSNKKDEYTLADIHKKIKEHYNLSDELSSTLIDLELYAEEKLIIPRNDIKKLLLELYESKKNIVLITDMYLSSEQIRRLLVKCGYPSDLNILVSNECKKTKQSGALWEEFFAHNANKTTLHIGDNEHSDYTMVCKYGREAILIDSPIQKFENTEMYEILCEYDNGEFGNSLFLGKFCNSIFYNSVFSNDYIAEDITGLWLGSVLSSFVRWLINNRDDSLLAFVTREGYILQPMYQQYCNIAGVEPQKNCLFYASRKASSSACATSEENFKAILDLPYEGSLKNFLKSRLDYEYKGQNSNLEIELPKDAKIVNGYCSEIKKSIFESASQKKLVYDEYINKCLIDSSTKELTIVDIGYQASTQYFLSMVSDKKISGKYFMLSKTVLAEKNGCKCDSLALNYDGMHPVYDNLLFLEAAMQVPYGQLISLDKDENGTFIPKCNEAKQTSNVIANAQKKFLEFAEWDAEWYGLLGKDFNYSLDLAESMWMCIIYYALLPNELMQNFILDDEFNGNNMWKYYPEKHTWVSEITETPFVFYKNKSRAYQKQKMKNYVKKHAPDFLYEPLRLFWIKYIK